MENSLIIFGVRPKAIEMVTSYGEYRKYADEFEIIFSTSIWYREMLDYVSKFFEVIPDYNLDIMRRVQKLFLLTARGIALLYSRLYMETLLI